VAATAVDTCDLGGAKRRSFRDRAAGATGRRDRQVSLTARFGRIGPKIPWHGTFAPFFEASETRR
jgi:hypothetical protein